MCYQQLQYITYQFWPSKTQNQISCDVSFFFSDSSCSDCHHQSCLSIILSLSQSYTFPFHIHIYCTEEQRSLNPSPIRCICSRPVEELFPLIIFHDHCFLSHLSIPPSFALLFSPISLFLHIRARCSLSANQKSPPPLLHPPKTPNQRVPPPLGLPARHLTQKPRPCPQRAPQSGPSSTP